MSDHESLWDGFAKENIFGLNLNQIYLNVCLYLRLDEV